MFSNVTKQIKQIAKQEENRNTPLPIRGEKPITPLGYNIASYAPIVGDAIQLGEGISDIKNRNYLAGAINLGLLAFPNAIEKPLKNIGKIVKNIKLVGEDGKILNSKIIRKPENFYRSVDKSAILDAKKSGFIRGNFPEEEIHGNPYFARTKEPFNWRKYVIEGNTNSADKWISASGYNNGKIVEVPRKPTIDFSKSYDVGKMSYQEYANYINNYEVFPMTNGNVNASPASKFTYWQKYPIFGWRKKNFKYGGIHIKPSKRGTFTAAAKKHGMSVQGFASKVLANKGKYSSAMVKKANFARNASKWKHKEFGGDMDFNYWITKDNIYKLGGRKKGQWGLQDYSNAFKVDLQPFVPTTVQGTTTNINNALSLGIPNIIGTGLNLAGNVASYFVNRRALKSMQPPVAPSAPTPLRAENLETRVSTAAQEAALRENIAKQENLIAGNLSSSRSRLNAVNAIRNQGIGLYNQLQERKQNVQTELINRAKLNRQQINSQNTLLANQYKDNVTNWRNSVIDFENKRRDALSENTIQHLIQGPIDAIAGERGYFANLENNKRYRITAFLNAIGNPYAHKAVTSGEFLPLAKQFGLTEKDLKSLGLM